MRDTKRILILAVSIALLAAPAWSQTEIREYQPWLNWTFTNNTGGPVNDFEIIVEYGSWTPLGWCATPFPQYNLEYGDFDSDGDDDTKVRWSGCSIPSGGTAHVGLYMEGAGVGPGGLGSIIDAYWTHNNTPIRPGKPVTYEKTLIVLGAPPPAPENRIQMALQIQPGYFLDRPQTYVWAGWTNIRTFVDIPAGTLGLADLNESLDLSTLALYEVQPRRADTMDPIGLADEIKVGPGGDFPADSFFDVFLAESLPAYRNSDYEALLVADVIVQGTSLPVGQFWNLNPQSPEPATLGLVGLGGLALLRRRRRKA